MQIKLISRCYQLQIITMECFKCNQQQSSLVFYLSSSWRDQLYCESKKNAHPNSQYHPKFRNFPQRISLKKLPNSKLQSLEKAPEKAMHPFPIQNLPSTPISIEETQTLKQFQTNSNIQRTRTMRQHHVHLNSSISTYPIGMQMCKKTPKYTELPLIKIQGGKEMHQTAETSKQSGYFKNNQSFTKKAAVNNSNYINSTTNKEVPHIRVSACKDKQNHQQTEEEVEGEFQNDLKQLMAELHLEQNENEHLLKPEQIYRQGASCNVSPSLIHIKNIEDMMHTKTESVGDTFEEQSELEFGLRSYNRIKNNFTSQASISKNNSESVCSVEKKKTSKKKNQYRNTITAL